MKKVGLIGWRGMVGSVLMDRMAKENDLKHVEPIYFTTSQAGQIGPNGEALKDAHDIKALSQMDIIITCQGGDYTKKIYPEIRSAGWNGYWIDAASTLRMADDSIIILDPVNLNVIKKGLQDGCKTFVGGNCTVSLMLMGVGGLFKENLVEWATAMTYQAASGSGAKNMIELVKQMQILGNEVAADLDNPAASALKIDKKITQKLHSGSLPDQNFGVPLCASLIPWIDTPVETGQTREEWKGLVETNKILGTKNTIPIDGQCIRIGTMRCHSQALTIKLTKDVPTTDIENIIANANDWVSVVPNNKEATIHNLTPTKVTGTLSVPVGRIRKLNMGPDYLTLFTVGDQLLWGAAEPLRRMLNIILDS
jgi:aspartate-semialdehyde dehydrogenase